MGHYLQWINRQPLLDLHPLIRAPLSHYYFERIHPFYDGNGRVGRVIEAIIPKCSGMMYEPFGLAKSYLEHLDEYFTVFNFARKAELKKDEFPITAFIEFFLNRLREVFNQLHSRVNDLTRIILFENMINTFYHEGILNNRQFSFLTTLLTLNTSQNLDNIRSATWYKSLYTSLSAKTKNRDLKRLVDMNLISIEKGLLKLELP